MGFSKASPRGRAYDILLTYQRSRVGREGLEALARLGGSWSPTDKPHVIVPGLAQIEDAPPLPELETYTSRAAFLAGAAWALSLLHRKANR